MGETKLIANMKEEDFKKYKKEIEKKEDRNREELMLIRRMHNTTK
jgi:hypothetical protein